MKILLILLFASFTTLGQTRKNAVESEIVGFITNDLESLKGAHNAYFVFEKPIAFDKSVLSIPSLKEYFTRKELTGFKRSSHRQVEKWSFSSPTVNIVKRPNLDSLNRTDHIYYSYSTPLLSDSGNRMLVTKAFFCGLLCGGGATFLCEKRDGLWKKVQAFKEWGE